MGDIRRMWMTAPELAEALGFSLRTIYKMRSATPHRLPTARRLPGSRRVVWLVDDVRAWLIARPKEKVT